MCYPGERLDTQVVQSARAALSEPPVFFHLLLSPALHLPVWRQQEWHVPARTQA